MSQHDSVTSAKRLLPGQIQISACGTTLRVHAEDGSTVGRFSKRFSMDPHTTGEQQLQRASQCLHCTHEPAGAGEWSKFRELMLRHHGIDVPESAVRFETGIQESARNARTRPELILSLKGIYFDQILAGTKTEEYRLCTEYWRRRLEGCSYSLLVITRGYPPRNDESRRAAFSWEGFTRRTIEHPHVGVSPVEVYAIATGKRP